MGTMKPKMNVSTGMHTGQFKVNCATDGQQNEDNYNSPENRATVMDAIINSLDERHR